MLLIKPFFIQKLAHNFYINPKNIIDSILDSQDKTDFTKENLSTEDVLNFRRTTAKDHGLDEGTCFTWSERINDKGEKLLRSYNKDINSLSENNKLVLSDYLVKKSEKNSRYYMDDNYIIAAKLNPKKYLEFAKEKILEGMGSGSSFYYKVIPNLLEIGLTKEEAKREVLIKIDTVINNISSKDYFDYPLKTIVETLRQLNENERIDKIGQYVFENFNDFSINEYLFCKDFGISEGGGSSPGGFNYFDYKGKVIHYRNRGERIIINEKKLKDEGIKTEGKDYRLLWGFREDFQENNLSIEQLKIKYKDYLGSV